MSKNTHYILRNLNLEEIMKRLIALALILGFTSVAVYAAEADCKPGQDPKKDHCKQSPKT